MSDDFPFEVRAAHLELHDGKSDKFWRYYILKGVWVAHWGPCGAPVGQYKHFVTSTPFNAVGKKLDEKMRKGYWNGQERSWHVSEGFWAAILNGEGLTDLGWRFNQLLGGTFVEPIDEVIAGLQRIRADFSDQ